MGVMQRGGELRARKMASDGREHEAEIKANVKPGAVVLTDEAKGYVGLQGTYDHYAVNHSAGEYVRLFFIHTNGLENAWSLFKRQVFGIHHWISAKHLDRYLDEFTFVTTAVGWRGRARERFPGARRGAVDPQDADRLMAEREKPLGLDMSFKEALARFGQADPAELPTASNSERKQGVASPLLLG